VSFNDVLGDSQSHASAFSSPGFVSLIETLKDASQVFPGDAYPSISYIDNN
jgi:hypothetical protein